MRKLDMLKRVLKRTEESFVKEPTPTGFVPKVQLYVVERVHDALMAEIVEILENGDSVAIPNIGKLYMCVANQREANNPKTGGRVTVPPKIRTRVKMYKTATAYYSDPVAIEAFKARAKLFQERKAAGYGKRKRGNKKKEA